MRLIIVWLVDQSELKLNWRLKIRLLFSRSEYSRLQTDFSIILVNVEINNIGLLLKPDSFLLEKILLVLEKFIDGDWTNVIFLDKS